VTVYSHIVSNRPDDTALILERGDGAETGYIIGKDASFPALEVEPVGDSSVDGEGIEVSGESIGARVFEIPLFVSDATNTIPHSQSAMVTAYETLGAMVRRIAENGGVWRRRAKNLTYAVEYEIQHANLVGGWDDVAEGAQGIRCTLVLTCRPFALGDSYDIWDDFAANTLGAAGKYNNLGTDWTRDAGAAGDLAISGGTLNVAANPTVEQRLIHTGTPRVYGDVAVLAKLIPGIVQNGMKLGVIIKRVDANNYLEAYIDDNGVNSRLSVRVVIAGAPTIVYGPANLPARCIAGEPLWLRGGIAGNILFAEHYIPETTPKLPHYLGQTPENETPSYLTLTAAQEAVLGKSITGRAGLVINGQNTSTSCDDFDVRANYHGRAIFSTAYAGRYAPAEIQIPVSTPGSAPALLDVSISAGAGGATTDGSTGGHLFAWFPEPEPWNRCLDTLIDTVTTPVWAIGIVAGVVTAAATSLVNFNTAAVPRPYSNQCGQATLPNTIDSGVSQFVPGEFLAGVTYTASVWVKSLSGSTAPVKLKFGVNGDITPASGGGATNLSAVWQQLTLTWRPTQHRYGAYFAVARTTAPGTALTFEMTEAMVYEGTTAPAYVFGGELPVGVIELDSGTTMTNVVTTAGGGHGGFIAIGAGVSQLVTVPIVAWPLRKMGRYVTVDYYALVQPGNTAASTYDLRLSTRGAEGATTNRAYAEPYGSAGRTGLPAATGAANRVYYVGTLTWDTYSTAQHELTLERLTGPNFTFGIDALFGVPVSACATTPTSTTAAMASVITPGAGYRWTKRYRSDGRAELALLDLNRQFATPRDMSPVRSPSGLSAPLRLPAGMRSRVMVVPTQFPLNYASHSGASTDAYAPATSMYVMQFGVRPRFHVAEPG